MRENIELARALLGSAGWGGVVKFVLGLDSLTIFITVLAIFIILYRNADHYVRILPIRPICYIVSCWGYLLLLLEYIMLKDKPYDISKTPILFWGSLVVALVTVMLILFIWKKLPLSVRQEIYDKTDDIRKKLRKPANIPWVNKFVNEKMAIRQNTLNKIEAEIAFIEDRRNPFVQAILTEAQRADNDFVEAATEIQYTSKKDKLAEYQNTIDRSINESIKCMEQLQLFIRRESEQRQIDEVKRCQEQILRIVKEKTRSTNKEESSDDFNLFAGCETPEDYKKRYRDLMKSYHPDGRSGDDEAVKTINKIYDSIRKEKNF